MIAQEEIEKIVDTFCEQNKIDKNIFEISSISHAKGGKDQRLSNRTKVVNKQCTYVIKYYYDLNLIVIWNYKLNTNMSYSLKTINEKLSKGIRCADKGKISHTNNQAIIYFNYSENLYKLLGLINNRI